MNDQVIKLILQLIGQGDIKDAIDALKDLQAQGPATAAALDQIEAADKAVKASAASAAPDIYDLADAYDVLGDEQTKVFTTAQQIGPGMKAAAAAAGTTASTVGGAATAVGSLGKAGADADKGAQQARQGMLDVSRAAQDFIQGGLGGILNNLEGLGRGVPAIGNNIQAAFTSVPAILTLVGLAAYTAMPYIKDFLASFDTGKATGFKDSLDELQKTIKGLLEKQGISLVDLTNLEEAQRELDRLKASQAAFNALKGAQTNLQEKVGKAVKDVVIEEAGGTDETSGAENLARIIEAARTQRGELFGGAENAANLVQRDLLRKRLQEAKDMQAGGTPEMVQTGMALQVKAESLLDALEAQMTQAARKAIGGMIGDAGRGINAAREAIVEEFDRAPDLFKGGAGGAGVGAGFRGKLELAAPENIKAQQEFDKANKTAMALAKQQEEDAKKAEAEARKVDANIKAADDAAKKVILDDLRNKIEIIKGIGTVDQAADELTRAAAAGGLKGESAFAKVKEGVDKRLRDELQQEGFRTPAGSEAVVAEPIGDVATQAAKAARIRAGAAEKKSEKAEEKGEQAGLKAEAKANEVRIASQVKKITTIVGPSYQKQFESVMATNAGNAALGRPSMDPALLRRQLQQQMAGAMRRRGADEQSANLASKGIAEKGTTDLSRQFAEKTGNNVERTLQVTAQHNQIFAAMIGRVNGQEARLGNVERTAGALLQQVHPRAQHQRRRGQP